MVEQTTPDFTSTQRMHFSQILFFPPISLPRTITGAEIHRDRKFMFQKAGKRFTISGIQDFNNKCMDLYSQYNVWR